MIREVMIAVVTREHYYVDYSRADITLILFVELKEE